MTFFTPETIKLANSSLNYIAIIIGINTVIITAMMVNEL